MSFAAGSKHGEIRYQAQEQKGESSDEENRF